jgi:3-hydroxyisobutyrate dehydrogenase-like beta-hydroxyacid dehydrogenase
MTSLGFVGLGTMGESLAGHLLAADPALAVYDVREEAIAQLAAQGATACGSPADVAARAETVFVSLPTPAVVEAVAIGVGGLIEGAAMRSYIDLSTTGTTVARRVAERLAERGVACLDAPVSGGPQGARAATLAVLASGPSPLFGEVEPLLRLIGANVFHVGDEPGQGQLAKLINNLMSATAMAITGEALALGVKGGLDPSRLLAAINKSSGRNTASEDKYPRCVVPGTFDYGFRLRLMTKDVNLCMDEAGRLGAPMLLGATVTQLWNVANQSGSEAEDFTVIAKLFEEWAGVKMSAG